MLRSVLQLLYPHVCEICSQELTYAEQLLCLSCSMRLPVSGFHDIRGNPVEKALWGRVPLEFASAGYVFGRESGLQSLIHLFKYGGRRDVAVHLGRLLGLQLQAHPMRENWTGIVPVPLHPSKLRKRGYNQSEALMEGMAGVNGFPPGMRGLVRTVKAGSQTKRSRIDRWENVASGYSWAGQQLENEHLLLVDDVLTTGATMEACARAILEKAPGVKLSVCCLAWTDR